MKMKFLQELIEDNSPNWWKKFAKKKSRSEGNRETVDMIQKGFLEIGNGCENDAETIKQAESEIQREAEEKSWLDAKEVKKADFEEELYDEVFKEDSKIFKFKKKVTCGADGWHETTLELLLKCSENAVDDYKRFMRTCMRSSVTPTISHLIQI